MPFPKTSLICLGIAYFSGFALGGVVQKPGLAVPAEYDANRVAVGQIFDRSYAAYQEYARGHDDLKPVNKSSSDSRNGWGASLVDALTTMKIMGRDDLFDDAVKQVANTDFSKSHTPDTVSVFETTIRYLGGMLSAYELNGKKDQVLLDKAKVLADKMAFAWVDGNDIPYGHIDFTTNSPTIDISNIAEAGTLTLEWSTLTKYTKNATYQDLAERSARKILKAPAPLPGLPAQGINPAGGQPVGGYVTWGGGSDSYFEYLIKYPRLTNTNDQTWADAWGTAVDSSIKTLLKTSSRGKYAYLADYDSNRKIRPIGSHLACFYGGNWLLGGKLMNNQTMVDIGLHLNDGCWNTYASTLTGIGPERFAFTPDDDTSFANLPPANQTAFNAAHGFWPTASYYYLRPEVMESNFYAWRLTGNPIYLERAAQVIQSFNKYLRTEVAYAGIEDVNQQNSLPIDLMESFWFAEVLKYLYLTFDDPSRYSLDKYVFNTEAHPFELPNPKPMYGTSAPTPTSDDHKSFTPADGDVPAVSPAPGVPSDLSNLLGGL